MVYEKNICTICASVPIAFERNRLQSATNKENSVKRGTFIRGDAAFADYVINMVARLN